MNAAGQMWSWHKTGSSDASAFNSSLTSDLWVALWTRSALARLVNRGTHTWSHTGMHQLRPAPLILRCAGGVPGSMRVRLVYSWSLVGSVLLWFNAEVKQGSPPSICKILFSPDKRSIWPLDTDFNLFKIIVSDWCFCHVHISVYSLQFKV